jgi:hypothetical protein
LFFLLDFFSLSSSYGCSVSAAGQVDAAINGMGDIPFGQLWSDI